MGMKPRPNTLRRGHTFVRKPQGLMALFSYPRQICSNCGADQQDGTTYCKETKEKQ